MTVVVFQTSPIFQLPVNYENRFSILFIIWTVEVLAYIFIAKIEEIALKAKYGKKYLEYMNDVAFIIPFLKIRKIKA
jgi:protein-S-isoprenylcysteine O-methyltransferase Ste14